jgi:hypothetical protein
MGSIITLLTEEEFHKMECQVGGPLRKIVAKKRMAAVKSGVRNKVEILFAKR